MGFPRFSKEDDMATNRRDYLADRKAAYAALKQTAVEEGSTETATDDDAGHVCPRCEFEAKTAGGLGSHMRTHADD